MRIKSLQSWRKFGTGDLFGVDNFTKNTDNLNEFTMSSFNDDDPTLPVDFDARLVTNALYAIVCF